MAKGKVWSYTGISGRVGECKTKKPSVGGIKRAYKGCSLASPGRPWQLTLPLGDQKILVFAPNLHIYAGRPGFQQVRDFGCPTTFLRAQPCLCSPILVNLSWEKASLSQNSLHYTKNAVSPQPRCMGVHDFLSVFHLSGMEAREEESRM